MIVVFRTGAAAVPSNRFMGVRPAGNGQYIAQVGCDLTSEILLHFLWYADTDPTRSLSFPALHGLCQVAPVSSPPCSDRAACDMLSTFPLRWWWTWASSIRRRRQQLPMTVPLCGVSASHHA